MWLMRGACCMLAMLCSRRPVASVEPVLVVPNWQVGAQGLRQAAELYGSTTARKPAALKQWGGLRGAQVHMVKPVFEALYMLQRGAGCNPLSAAPCHLWAGATLLLPLPGALLEPCFCGPCTSAILNIHAAISIMGPYNTVLLRFAM